MKSMTQILHKINNKALNCNLYQTLKIYDQFIKQQAIDPSSQIALKVYAVLLEQEFKNTSEINDPELQFSFSKQTKKQKYNETNFNSKKLFVENQFRSERQNYKNSNEIVCQVSKFKIKESNDYNEGQINRKIKQIKENRLRKTLKLLISRPLPLNQIFKTQFMNKRSRYFRKITLLKITWKTLKINVINHRKRLQKLGLFQQMQNNKILTQYFNNWKTFSKLSEKEKEQISKIQDKIHLSSKTVFIGRLIKNSKLFGNYALETINLIRKKNNLKIFTKKVMQQKKINLLKTVIQNNLKKNGIKNFISSTRIIINKDKLMYSNQIQKMLVYQKKSFIKKLNRNFEINEAYWKDKKKVLFVWMLLSAIKFQTDRNGQFIKCLNEIQENIQNTPKGIYIAQYRKRKSFNALKNIVYQSKCLSKIILQINASKFIYSLTRHFKTRILYHQNNERKENCLVYLQTKRKRQVLNTLLNNGLGQKKNQLYLNILKRNFVRVTLYLSAQKLANQNYTKKTALCKQLQLKNSIMRLFKMQKLENQNKETKKKYNKLKKKLISVKGIFMFKNMKSLWFQRKIQVIKLANLQKKFKSTNFYHFFKVYKEGILKKSLNLHKNIQKLAKKLQTIQCINRLNKIYNNFKQKSLLKKIQLQIDSQRSKILLSKIFVSLKTHVSYQKVQRQKIQRISQSYRLNMSQKILDCWFARLTQKLIFINIERIIQKYFKYIAFRNLQQQK